MLSGLRCGLEALVIWIFQRGPHALGPFILLSGFGITYSLVRKGDPAVRWVAWYRRRLIRLFPMYWAAHIIYLVSPFIYGQDPIDMRFPLSFLGDRIFPVDLFYYLNPSWWFFGLLLQFYLVFPLLFRSLQRLGPLIFLLAAVAATVFFRYLLNDVLQVHGNLMQGAFVTRLWEFSAGMAFAWIFHQNPVRAERILFDLRGFLAGLGLYVIGIYSYQPNLLMTVSDGLIGMGFSIILAHTARIIAMLGAPGRLIATAGVFSYSIFLLHQPYMMYVGNRVQSLGILPASLVALGVLAVLGPLCVILERAVGRLSDRIFGSAKASPPRPPSIR
jgi:peptidoglycan/LPS O-acetylase OafA/YrhL